MAETSDVGLLQRGAVLMGGRARELVVATGADRVRFLHGIVTGDVAGTPVGGGCRSALLTLKAHVVADMFVFVRPDDVWIVTDAGQGGPTAAALARYAIMDDVAFAWRDDFAQLAVLGPEAAARLEGARVALPGPEPLAHASSGDLWVARVRELGADGYWVAGVRADVAKLAAALEAEGVATLSVAAAEAARVAAFEPRWGAEITSDYFPMEVGLSGAIDYAKGCFLGQEPIVRLRDRGHINWRLVQLEVPGAADPAPGDVLESDAKPKAGRITSAARGVALGMLHVSVPVGASIRIKHGEGVLEARVTKSV